MREFNAGGTAVNRYLSSLIYVMRGFFADGNPVSGVSIVFELVRVCQRIFPESRDGFYFGIRSRRGKRPYIFTVITEVISDNQIFRIVKQVC